MLNQLIQRELIWFYPWLQKMAYGLMARERRHHTLRPTALVHEILVKLLAWRGELSGDTERSLRALAITIAKQTLIDHGRRYGSRQTHLREVRDRSMNTFRSESRHASASRFAIVLDAIEDLERIDPAIADMVRLRFLQGHSHQETVALLSMSPRTAARRWAFAKAFLSEAILQADSHRAVVSNPSAPQ
jgi:RNA polymerase sigma factor (sigma-70 family)